MSVPGRAPRPRRGSPDTFAPLAGGPRRAASLLLAAAMTLAGRAALAAQEDGAAQPPDTAAVAAAASPRVDSLTTRVASQLRCPVCRSQSVLESSSDLANRMQSVIRDRLARGESPAEVRAYFVDKYGEWILLKPEPEGINLLVYLLPALALVGGGWAVARRLRDWSSEGVTDEDAAVEDDADPSRSVASDLDLPEEDREWLERELRERRGGTGG